MRAIEDLAISKVITAAAVKAARERLAVGVHDVDITVRVKGSLDIRPDEQFIPTVEIPLLATMALFVRKSGIMREHVLELLKESMTEALERGEKGIEKTATVLAPLEEETVIRDAMNAVKATIAQLPLQTRKGKVLPHLTIEPVGD